MFIRVAKILTYTNGRALTNATGFFYLHEKFLYLVTARHVVINEAVGHRPEFLQVSLHSDADDLRQRAELPIPLYQDGVPQWYEHPRHGPNADVAVVAINDSSVLSRNFVRTFNAADIVGIEHVMPIGQDVLIAGFPLGFHDTLHNLPIVRSATIASSFSHPFQGELYFLTDARLHRGTSGSPVIARLPCEPSDNGQHEQAWRLLGIHSSALDVSDRDLQQDERLALNMTWYASLIPEMLPDRRAANQTPEEHRKQVWD